MNSNAVPIVRGRIRGQTTHPRRLSPMFIQRMVCDEFGLSWDAMTTHARPEHIAFPRQIAMALCHELTTLDYTQIAEHFNRRNWTVMWAVDRVKNRMATEPDVREQVEKLKARLGA